MNYKIRLHWLYVNRQHDLNSHPDDHISDFNLYKANDSKLHALEAMFTFNLNP